VAFDPVGFQQAVQPEAIEPGFLDHDNLDRLADPPSREARRAGRAPSPALTVRLDTFSSPGALVATSQDFADAALRILLSSSAANRMLSSGRTVVGAGWGKSVQVSLHEVLCGNRILRRGLPNTVIGSRISGTAAALSAQPVLATTKPRRGRKFALQERA
jgi:hypothetical protein